MKKLIVLLLILNLLANMANLLNATKKSRKKYELADQSNVMAWINYLEIRMDDELRINGQKPLVLKKVVSELTRTLLIKDVITEKEWANIMGNSEENDTE